MPITCQISTCTRSEKVATHEVQSRNGYYAAVCAGCLESVMRQGYIPHAMHDANIGLSADIAIKILAESKRAFSTDDIWSHVGRIINRPAYGRAIANAMMRAERRGLIKKTRIGTYRRGWEKHPRWLTVWISIEQAGTLDDAAQYATGTR